MQDSGDDDNVRVCCRFRPVNDRERAEGAASRQPADAHIKFLNDATTEVFNRKRATNDKYTLDRIFPQATQEEMFDYVGRRAVEDVLQGYNGTVLVYGQTGSGKSFTMFGPDIMANDKKGIIPRSCDYIFQHIENDENNIEYTIKCSFLEIYKEQVKDLLDPSGKILRVREAPSKGVWVEGLSEHYVGRSTDVLQLIKLGEKYRAVSATDMNAESSRSHSLFILNLLQKLPDGGTKSASLNLCDLAGSEKVGKTGATGNTLEEAKKINQSLSALGNCINALTKGKKSHVPYRDSKLTHILRESLGGNTKTTLVVCASPHIFNIDETISTLRFAQRAKTIKNTATINQQRSVEELEAIVKKLSSQLKRLQQYISLLESELEKANPGVDLTALKSSVASIVSTPKATRQRPAVTGSSASPSSSLSVQVTEGESDDDESTSTAASSSSSSASSASSASNLSASSSLLGRAQGENLTNLAELQVKYEKMKAESTSLIQDLREQLATQKEEDSRLQARCKELETSLAKDWDAEFKQLEGEKERLEFEARSRALELSREKKKVSLLHTKLEDLTTKLEAEKLLAQNSQTELARMTEDRDRLQRIHTSNTDRLTRLEKQKGRIDLQNKKLLNALETEKQSHEELQSRVKTLEENELQAQKLRESCVLLQKQVVDAKASQQNAELQLRTVQESQQKKNQEKNDLLSSVTALKAELSAHEQQVATLDQEKHQLAASINELEVDKTTLTAELASIRESFETQVSNLETEMQQRDVLLAELKQRNTATLDQNLKLEQTIKTLNETITSLREQVNVARQEHRDEQEKLNTQLTETQVKLANAHDASSKQKGIIAELEARLESLQSENSILTDQQTMLMEREAGAHSEELSSLLSQLEKQAHERSSLNERIASLKGELTQTTEEIVQLRLARDQTQQELENSRANVTKLTESIAAQQSDHEVLVRSHEQTESELAEAKDHLGTLEQTAAEAIASLSERTRELEVTKKEAATKEECVRELKQKLSILENKLNAKEEEMRKRSLELDTIAQGLRQEHEGKVELLQGQLNDEMTQRGLDQQESIHLRGEVEKLQIELSDAREHLKRLKTEESKKNQIINQMKTKLAEMQETVDESTISLQQKVSSLDETLKLERDTVSTQAAQLEDVRTKLQETVNLLKAEKERNAIERIQHDNLVKACEMGEEQIRGQSERLVDLEVQNHTLQGKMKHHEEILHLLRSAYPDLDARLEEQRVLLRDAAGLNTIKQHSRGGRVVTPIRASKREYFFGSPAKTLPKRNSIIGSHIQKEGFLVKQGGVFKTWKRRFFILLPDVIYYYKDRSAQEALGAIPLAACEVLPASKELKKPHSFGVYHPTQRTYFLSCTSASEMSEWMDAIRLAIDQCNMSAPH